MTIINGKAEAINKYTRRENSAAGRGIVPKREGAQPASLSQGSPHAKNVAEIWGSAWAPSSGSDPWLRGGPWAWEAAQAPRGSQARLAQPGRCVSPRWGCSGTEVFSSISSPDLLRPEHPGA